MDFDDSAAEAAFRTEARAWLEANAPKKGSPDDFSQGYFAVEAADPADRPALHRAHIDRCKAWQATLLTGGWACITWPAEFGGRGGTGMEATIFAEEQSNYGVANDVFAVAIGMVGPTVIAHGTDEQKARYLDPLLRGDELWCQLFSEPGAGSDLAGIATKAVRDGDEFVVTGQKVWTSDAGTADQGILLARTDPEAPKHAGITYFLVDMATAGIEIRPLKQMTGGTHFAEVFLDEVRIPAANVLGQVNGGWSVAMTTLLNERVFIGGSVKRFSTEDLVDLARSHDRDRDPTVRQGIASAHIRTEILTYLGYRIRTAVGRGEAPGPEASCMKLSMAKHLRESFDLALAIQGAAGVIDGDKWHQQFLGAPAIRIAGGSDEIQRNVIGERALGLPGDVRVDKGIPFNQIPTSGSRAGAS
jgi:alkylation response protein AidB-like acyl-CoA dehydrogenase